jgi:hypothetical protein
VTEEQSPVAESARRPWRRAGGVLYPRVADRLKAERGDLAFVALAFALNKVLVLAASSYANWGQLSTRGLRGFIEWVVVDNYRFYDFNWYQEIARDGYQLKSAAFFPLYPLAMKGAQALLDVRFLTAGVLVSHAAFILLLYVFLRLARLDLDRRRARSALLLLALYPTSFYFSAAYTEALFFLLSALALLAMRTRCWPAAGVFGALAALTRNTGVLLAVPFAIEYGTYLRERRSRGEPLDLRGLLPGAWGSLIGLAGLAYMAFLWRRFGDPFAFASVQELYGRGSLPPWRTLYEGYVHGLGRLVAVRDPFDWRQMYHPTQLYFVTLVLVVLVASFRRLRWSYWVMILYSSLIPLFAPAAPDRLTDYFISFSRYSLVVVPLYLGLERLLRPRPARWAYLAVSVLLLLLMTWAWSHHRWVA